MTKRELLERADEPSSVVVQALEPRRPAAARRCPTTCSPATPPRGSTTGCPSTPCASGRRIRETIHYEAIYRWHPFFADAGFNVWADGTANGMATTEGGDILVLGRGAVLVGMSERTTPQGVERLARRLFRAGSATRIVALSMPQKRAFMHLDTVMTMVDEDTFTKYVGLGMLPSYTIEPGDTEQGAEGDPAPCRGHARRDRRAPWASTSINVLTATQDVQAAEREQWDDGCNVLAVAPRTSSSPTSATSPPTPTCARTASRSSPSRAASSAAAAAARAA